MKPQKENEIEVEAAEAVKVKPKMNPAMNAMNAAMNEKEFDATAVVKVKVKLKGKVPEAGIAEVKVSGSTGMNKSYSWARMTPLCFNPERVLFRGPLGGNAVCGAAA